jgi:hypothetical protein
LEEAIMSPVHEIAVRSVKPGRSEAFRTRRRQFIDVLTTQAGVGTDREFQSFQALPEPDPTEVFIGMTTYDGLAANARVQRNPRLLWRFMSFARTMDLKAYVYVEPTEGPAFDLAALAAEPGQVLELAVRRVADPAAFNAARKDFLARLDEQPGVLGSWEFRVVKGRKTDGLTVGMTVYESQDALQTVFGALMPEPVTQAYFATFEPVAVQYAVPVSS